MNSFGFIFSLIIFLQLANCKADTFSILGDQNNLKNKIILDAGNAKFIHNRTKNTSTIKLNEKCYFSEIFFAHKLTSETASLLLIDNNKNLYIAILNNSVLSVDVTLAQVTESSCTSDQSNNSFGSDNDKEVYDSKCKLAKSYKGNIPIQKQIEYCAIIMSLEQCTKCLLQ